MSYRSEVVIEPEIHHIISSKIKSFHIKYGKKNGNANLLTKRRFYLQK